MWRWVQQACEDHHILLPEQAPTHKVEAENYGGYKLCA
jgi:hypothetical protein